MEPCVETKLNKLGFKVRNEPYTYIKKCNAWYRNELIDDFHKRVSLYGEEYEIERMNFAKRCCADDANLCEIISINVGNEEQSESVGELLKNNNFETMYRQQLELTSATGTVASYVRLDNANYLDNGKVVGGDVRISYCEAGNYIPLTVINNRVVEAAFSGTDITTKGKKTTLVTFTLDESKQYIAHTYVFDKSGKEVEDYWIQLGEVKPFAVMRVAEVNNLKNMDGFGLPKLLNAIPSLKKIDLCNMILNGDLDKGEKVILTNEALVEINEHTGKPKKPNKMLKRLFVFIGHKLPEQDSVIKEYNPEIRIDKIKESFEFCLSLLSMMFGFGSKKYQFENGQIQTATQYIGERQDSMQELNKQRNEAIEYISDLIKAMMWFSNAFCDTNFDTEAEICVDFDDSYIEDKNSKIEAMRNDAQTFSDIPEFTIKYIMERFNVDRDRALKIYEARDIEEDPETLD